jgi:hypothetical protein
MLCTCSSALLMPVSTLEAAWNGRVAQRTSWLLVLRSLTYKGQDDIPRDRLKLARQLHVLIKQSGRAVQLVFPKSDSEPPA